MKHRPRPLEQADLLRPRLVDMIDGRHELVRLAALIDWSWFEREWAGFFPTGEERPATHFRLVTGLLYLQHAYSLSDEAVFARWMENPYFQHFTGEVFFQHRPPIHPSSLSRWRGRMGEEEVEWLLTKTIEAGRASGTSARSGRRAPCETQTRWPVVGQAGTSATLWLHAPGQSEVPRQGGIAPFEVSHRGPLPQILPPGGEDEVGMASQSGAARLHPLRRQHGTEHLHEGAANVLGLAARGLGPALPSGGLDALHARVDLGGLITKLPLPQITRTPMRSRSTCGCAPRKSTVALNAPA
jgi:hypothetical protein